MTWHSVAAIAVSSSEPVDIACRFLFGILCNGTVSCHSGQTLSIFTPEMFNRSGVFE
jgi:hypothetical protein